MTIVDDKHCIRKLRSDAFGGILKLAAMTNDYLITSSRIVRHSFGLIGLSDFLAEGNIQPKLLFCIVNALVPSLGPRFIRDVAWHHYGDFKCLCSRWRN